MNNLEYHYFNSSMVQLKRVVVDEISCIKNLFQFLDGTIKTLYISVKTNGSVYFNSSMVQLKRDAKLSDEQRDKYFNSSMVQLKQQRGKYLNRHYLHFNSSMVQLKR